MRIAVVGSGISGLVAALVLDRDHDVTLFERSDRLGGHSHTRDVELHGRRISVDTGFIVHNRRTYPGLVALFHHLGVPTRRSEMSFSVSDQRSGLEWSSTPLGLARPDNLRRPSFRRLLSDVVRFNRAARELARVDGPDDRTLGQLVDALGLSPGFVDWYLVPMGAAIWSADPSTVTAMPASTLARFFDSHGLLQLGGRPRWRTVAGGSIRYVEALVGRLRGRVHVGTGVDAVVRHAHGVDLCTTTGGRRTFDHVVLAVHSDQALRLLADPTRREQEILGAIRYRPNRALLHTDTRLLPRAPAAWASWNYRRPARSTGEVAVTYLMNRLHRARWPVPVLVTLNQDDQVDPGTVLAEATYHHPVLDGPAVAAQRRHVEIDGRDRVSFAGAYWGNGFHEDGLQSAVRVCRSLGSEVPW